VVGNAIVVMQNASMMVVENAINAVPDNNPEGAGYGYGSWEAWHSSAPYIMQGGTFAEELPNAAYNVLSGEVTKYINSSAVAAAWITQGVFVAKRTDSINGNSPCDISLDKLDGARACSSDGSTAYFWMLSQTLTPSYAWGDYQGVPGVSNVGNYGLDLYEMAESADWLNSAYGSYLPQPSVQDIYTDLTSSDPIPNGLFINVPVMSADGLSPPSLYDQGGLELGDEVSTLDALPLGPCADYLMSRQSSLLKSWSSFCFLVTGHILYLIRVRLSLVMCLRGLRRSINEHVYNRRTKDATSRT
jgi:hypothetical protein